MYYDVSRHLTELIRADLRLFYLNPYSFGHILYFTFNPYSVLTHPGGVLEFLKITQFINIFLFVACEIRKYLIFIHKTRNMSDAVRVKNEILYH